jgi:hypothetical protein
MTAAPDDVSDALVGAMALIEADGGLPGNSPEERAAATLALLLALCGEGHSPKHGPFALHMRRMVAFVRSIDASTLGQEQQDLVRAAIDVLDGKGESAAFSHEEVARITQPGGMTPAEAWEWIRRTLGADTGA